MKNPAMLALRLQLSTPSAELDVDWPAPVRTLGGAVRTLLHDISGVGPSQKKGATVLNDLTLRGPALHFDFSGTGEFVRLLPWPAHVLCCSEGQALPFADRPTPGEPFWLPPLSAGWLTCEDFFVVASCAGSARQFLPDAQLKQRSAALALELQLWAKFSHKQDCYAADSVAMLAQLGAQLAQPTPARLGTYGPPLQVSAMPASPLTLPPLGEARRCYLIFCTHADFDGDWKPQDFTLLTRPDGRTVWRGHLRGASAVLIDILAAYMPPMLQESGWDSNLQRARPLRHLVAAGSAWRCEIVAGNAEQLPYQQLGLAPELGRGEFVLVPDAGSLA